jgi:hypothetical protein
MKFGIFDNFGAKNSAPVFDAFKQGLDVLNLPHKSHDIDADVAVIWSVVWAGRMKANLAIWQQFRAQGRPVIVLEVGMLARGRTWKMAVNGTGSQAYHGHGTDPDRPGKLGVGIKPWRRSGDHILVCTQRTDSLQWQDQPDIGIWLTRLRDQVTIHTQRSLVLRPHPRQRVPSIDGFRIDPPILVPGTYDTFDLGRGLGGAWAVINHNSGPGVQAILQGVPAFVHESSLAAPVANIDLADIEHPAQPDRDTWLIDLCHTEWLPEEIARGWPIQRLLPGLQSC